MLKIDWLKLDKLETSYPGITEEILRFDAAQVPRCVRCGAENTAAVYVGLVGRSINISAATSKFNLIANSPKPGNYFCHACGQFFG